MQRIREGTSLIEATENDPSIYAKYHRGLLAYKQALQPDRTEKTRVLWLCGPTGSGKSRHCRAVSPSAYWKDLTKWWDGYDNERDVVIDDYRPSKELPLRYMLLLLDRYPMRVESKGGYLKFNSERIFITSPQPPRETFSALEWLGEEDIAQLLRRIDEVIVFSRVFGEQPREPTVTLAENLPAIDDDAA